MISLQPAAPAMAGHWINDGPRQIRPSHLGPVAVVEAIRGRNGRAYVARVLRKGAIRDVGGSIATAAEARDIADGELLADGWVLG